MSSSAQLEQEAERTRAQLTQSLAELRERMTPGQLVDQAVGYAKESGGGDFVRKLGRQVADNPLPITLIGAGMAWLMLARGGPAPDAMSRDGVRPARARAGGAIDPVAARMSDASSGAGTFADRTRDAATNAMENAGSRLSATASAAGDGARSFYDAARSTTADAFERASDSAARAGSSTADSIAGIGPRAAAAADDIVAFCREQPLVTAALGLTLGAILGAFMPQTETEDNLMGSPSDRFKREAQTAAKDEYEKARSAVRSGVAATRAEAQCQGPERQGPGQEPIQEPGGTVTTDPDEAPLVPADDSGALHQPAESGEPT